jgi:class 3 adenylate cyclase/tetratricopeptide (TPR) repeat protein/DNA polymerase III delta prime subunit
MSQTHVAALLVTDQVRSTELHTSLGEEAGAELRRAHDRVLVEAVGSHGGKVVKGRGDGIMAAFDGAADALAAAVSIQQGIDRLSRRSPAAVLVRVGISVGDVTWEDSDCFGVTVIEATRLCETAEGGQILLADLVRAMSRGRGGHDFNSVGSLKLKGLPDPVPALELSWSAPTADEALPPALGASAGGCFVGRTAEFEALAAAWKQASEGSLRAVLVAGEPGVGKTRLAFELARRVHDDGGTVLYGRCEEDLGVPYQPFAEAIRTYVAACPLDDLVAHAEAHAGELTRLVPELARRVHDLPAPVEAEPEVERYRLFEAVAGLLATATRQAPVLFVLDDLHWAAKPTLLLLHHLVANRQPKTMLIVGTYRDTELGRDGTHPLAGTLADLRRHECVERLALDGLDIGDSAAFVEAAAGQSLDERGLALVRALHGETEGNPFFIGEIMRHLIETGGLFQPDGRTWQPTGGELGLPEGVREVIGRRLARLSEDTNRTLSVASVIGHEFTLELVGAAADRDEEHVLEAVEEALAARLLAERPGSIDCFEFSHTLVRNVIYSELAESRRARLHRRVGEALENLVGARPDVRLTDLAHHFLVAAPTGVVHKAVRYSIEAADAAMASLAFEDTINLCRRGLAAVERARRDRMPIEDTDECDLLLRLGRAEVRAGRRGGRDTLLRAYEVACKLGDHRRLAEATLAESRGFFARMGRVDREIVEALETAIAAQPVDDSPVLAQLLATLASELVWAPDGERRFELSDQALAMARRCDDARTLARVLLLRDSTISAPDTLTERIAECDELLQIADQLQDPAIRFQAAFQRGGTAIESGDVDAASEMVDRADMLARELHQPTLVWQAGLMRTSRKILGGALDDAEQRAIETLESGRRANQDAEAFIFFTEQMLEIRRWQDRLGDMLADFRELAGVGRIDFGYSLMRYLYDAGEEEAAAACYDAVMERLPLPPRRDMLAATTLGNLAYLAARVGDGERAPSMYEMLLPFGDAFASTTVAKPAGWHHLGMLASTMGRSELAEDHFSLAVTLHEKARAPLLVAETKLEWARLLVGRGADLDRAAGLLDAVRSTATASGARFLERSCLDLSPA